MRNTFDTEASRAEEESVLQPPSSYPKRKKEKLRGIPFDSSGGGPSGVVGENIWNSELHIS